MLELWGMRITPLLSLLPVPLWPGVVALDWVLSMGQIKLSDIKDAYSYLTELFEIELFYI